jgi:hypothetical protein
MKKSGSILKNDPTKPMKTIGWQSTVPSDVDAQGSYHCASEQWFRYAKESDLDVCRNAFHSEKHKDYILGHYIDYHLSRINQLRIHSTV